MTDLFPVLDAPSSPPPRLCTRPTVSGSAALYDLLCHLARRH